MSPKIPILFIGPVRAGKSTLARLVSEQLQLPHVSLDEVRWAYYREIGYDEAWEKTIRAQGGFLAVVIYRQLFDPYSVQRVLKDYPNAVIDFGAGIGPFQNLDYLKHIQELLAPIPNTFLVLPSRDKEETLRILAERDIDPPADFTFDINRHFLNLPGYYILAKHTIYNHGKTPEESSQEVLKLLR